ncbi:MAG: antitermination protein NusG [Gammaproteobacteria bacterium]|nr:antitermination protein NusG [Gammaproteobacteria bacterium]
MITKILFTAAVIAGVIAFYRVRSQHRTKPVEESSPETSSPATRGKLDPAHLTAYGIVAVLLSIGAVLYYLDWAEDHRVVSIRVINTQTGETVIYQAYQSKIQGRSFETIDGRAVSLADVERVETTVDD